MSVRGRLSQEASRRQAAIIFLRGRFFVLLGLSIKYFNQKPRVTTTKKDGVKAIPVLEYKTASGATKQVPVKIGRHVWTINLNISTGKKQVKKSGRRGAAPTAAPKKINVSVARYAKAYVHCASDVSIPEMWAFIASQKMRQKVVSIVTPEGNTIYPSDKYVPSGGR